MKKSLQILFAVSMFILLIGSVNLISATWNNPSLNYQKSININGGSSTLNNFTILLNVSYSANMNSNFSDLRFINGDCSGVQTTNLSFEFDKVINSNAALVWVKIPTLNTGLNTICMYYGNATFINAQDTNHTWDDNYKGVYHFTEGTGTNIGESKGNGNGTYSGTANWVSNELIGNAINLNGASSINLAVNKQINFSHPPVTIETWINQTTNNGGTYYPIISGGANNGNFYLVVGPYGPCGGSQYLRYGSIGQAERYSCLSPVTNQFNYVSWRDDGANAFMTMNKTDSVLATDSTTSSSISIGAYPSFNFYGIIDELRISNIARSSAWLNRSYDNQNMSMFSFSSEVSKIGINSETFNSTTYETVNENFIINMSNATSISNPYLNYNNINYPASFTTDSGGNYILSASLDIPTVTGITSNSFFWEVNPSTNSTIHIQIVNPTIFVLCNSTVNTKYINYTFKDEETNINVPATITSSFNYYLGSGTVSKTYTYQNTVENSSYAFCSSPTDRTYFVTPNIQYSNQNSTIRTYNSINPLTLTNLTTNQVLNLLKTSDGIYSSYQIVNTVQVPISNALVTVSLNGNPIESILTDSSGLSTFFLNPNSVYTITAIKSGYSPATVSVTPTQSTYTITLNSNANSNSTYYNQGVNISISPVTQFLNASTGYNFQVNFTDNLYNVTNWGFNITDGNTTLGTSGNLPQSTTIYTKAINTGITTSLSLTVFWNINGTTLTLTKAYTVQGLTGNGFSIYNGIIDLKAYLANGGIFGLSNSNINILIFLIIVIVTGISTYRFGISSPAVIAGIITIQVFLFDAVFGLVYYDPGFFPSKVPHVATVFMGIILITLIIREGTSY